MIKYVATALALKGFSCCSPMRRLYRSLGNRIGGRRRSVGPMAGYYLERVKRMLRLSREHRLVADGDRILELGTGWLHWEAITMKLFFDVKAVLYDVWDNRQLGGLRNYLRQLKPLLSDLELSPSELSRARSVLDEILVASSFDDLYSRLGFEYVVESTGSLERFADESFQLVVSAGVLEHVHRAAIPKFVAEMYRVLKRNGWAVHSIDTSDHLSHYDTAVSRKRYLAYPEWLWKAVFENEVQYINRVQRSEWLALFQKERFKSVEEDCREIDISNLKLSERYAKLDHQDLACSVLRLTFRK